MHITMISAMDRNRVIGSDNGGIPWHLPRDTRHFREFTLNKHLLLGRKTFAEMIAWFTGQTPIVLSRNAELQVDTGFVAYNVEEAISIAAEEGAAELTVCGGGAVYEAALPYTDELFLTRIDTEVEGTIYFPDFEQDIEWEEVSREEYPADGENPDAMTFLQLRRLHPSSLRPSRMHLL
ncbi:MAG: dihydrofolate reductase [Verrucomicrobiales bacterium]|nr:dihydrofolate reductase [Verrucomicrobiales bacterium]